MRIPLSSLSGSCLSDHDDYLVFGELSETLVLSQDFLRGSEAGSDLPPEPQIEGRILTIS